MQITVLQYLKCSFRPALLVLAASLAFCCSEGGAKADESSPAPEVGSLFTMSVRQSVLGSVAPEEGKLNVTLRVADMIFEGKEHVAQFVADTTISLLAYEANGDLSLYLRRERIGPCLVEGEWLRFPFHGNDSVSQLLRVVSDSTPNTNGNHLRVRWSARPQGVERVIVGGKEMEACKVEGVLSVRSDSAEGSRPIQQREYKVWYAPTLGYIVREELVSLLYSDDRADTLGVSQRELTGYTLK